MSDNINVYKPEIFHENTPTRYPGTLTFCTNGVSLSIHQDGTVTHEGFSTDEATQAFLECLKVAAPGWINAIKRSS